MSGSRTMLACWTRRAAVGMISGALLAGACALPEYSTTASAGAGGAGAAGGAGGAGGVAGAGGATTTTSAGGGGGMPTCAPVAGYEVVACEQSRPGVVALSDSHAYWADETGNLLRASKALPSEPEILVPGTQPICSMVQVAGTLAWRTTANTIWRMALSDPQPMLVTTEQDSGSCEVSLDGEHVYFFGFDGTSYLIRRAALTGGLPVAISPITILLPGSLDVSRDPTYPYLYWSDSMAGKLYSADTVTPMPPYQVTTGSIPGLAADGGAVVYAMTGMAGQPYNIVKQPGMGGSGGGTIATLQTEVGPVRVTSNDVFWLAGAMPGPIYAELKRAKKSDMSVQGEVLASQLGAICGLAADEQHVYFTTCGEPGEGRVLRRSHLLPP